jgi:hypothetical protein
MSISKRQSGFSLRCNPELKQPQGSENERSKGKKKSSMEGQTMEKAFILLIFRTKVLEAP